MGQIDPPLLDREIRFSIQAQSETESVVSLTLSVFGMGWSANSKKNKGNYREFDQRNVEQV